MPPTTDSNLSPPPVPQPRSAVVADVTDDSERVIMYDEPTAGLDPVASTVVEDLMRRCVCVCEGFDSGGGPHAQVCVCVRASDGNG